MACITKSKVNQLKSNDADYLFYESKSIQNNIICKSVAEKDLNEIINDVKKQHLQNWEEMQWVQLNNPEIPAAVSQQMGSLYISPLTKKESHRTLAESLEEVERELKQYENNLISKQKPKYSSINEDGKDKLSKKNMSGIRNNEREKLETDSNSIENSCFKTEIDLMESCIMPTHRTTEINDIQKKLLCNCSKKGTVYKCHSGSEINPDRSSYDIDNIPVHPDPLFVGKILIVQKKILNILNEILFELKEIPLPDGDDDLLRRKQRGIEFSTRLSRNYLYDLNRHIVEIKRHIKYITSDLRSKLSRRSIIFHLHTVEQKLISAYQLLLHSLNAYNRHIPSSVLKDHPGKLRELLQIVLQLKNFCYDIKVTPDLYCAGDDQDIFLGKETESICNIILSKYNTVPDSESQKNCSTPKLISAHPLKNKKNRKILSHRLSMYSMDTKSFRTHQPKKSSSLQHFSNNHKCSTRSKLLSCKSNNSKIVTDNKNHRSKNSKKFNFIKEDDIRTVVESIPTELDNQSMRFKNSTQSLKDQSINLDDRNHYELGSFRPPNYLDHKKLECKNWMLKKDYLSLVPIIDDILKCRFQSKSSQNIESNELVPPINSTSNKRPIQANQEDKTLIRTDSKNTKLIYVVSDDEKINYPLELRKKDFVNLEPRTNTQDSNEKPRKNRTVLFVTQSSKICISNYRSQFEKSVKGNPLYKSNKPNKPWDIIAWISDKIVDEIIFEISNQLDNDEIIQKLYDLEFQ